MSGHTTMLQRGDLLPMFSVTDLRTGERVDYRTIWQHRELILVVLENDDRDGRYAAALDAQAPALTQGDAALVMTRDAVPGVTAPAVLVADRWGEVYYVASASQATDLPPPPELAEWLTFVQVQCPECQGETR